MAENQNNNSQERTEKPTQRKLDKAREEGKAVTSKEMYVLSSIVMMLAFFYFVASNYEQIVTIEDGSIAGGAGSAINEELNRLGIMSRVINLGIPDQFIDHAGQEEQYAICGIDSESIISAINDFEKTASENQSSYGSISNFPNLK